MFVTGAAVLVMRDRRATGRTSGVDPDVLGHDIAYFGVAYAIAVGAALLPADLLLPRQLTAVF